MILEDFINNAENLVTDGYNMKCLFISYVLGKCIITHNNTIQDGVQKDLPTSFSPITSINVGTNPQKFLTFSFDSFATLLYNFKVIPSASPKLLNFNQDHFSKKMDFLVKSL